jgi:hypothetical protein
MIHHQLSLTQTIKQKGGETMSKRKDRERAENGHLFRNGGLVSKDEAARMAKEKHEAVRERMSVIGKPGHSHSHPVVLNCAECGKPAETLVGDTPYCKTCAERLASASAQDGNKEAKDGETDTQAVHNADSSGGDGSGKKPRAGARARRSPKTSKPDTSGNSGQDDVRPRGDDEGT